MALRSERIEVFVVAPLLLCWGLEKLLNIASLGIRIGATAQSVEDALQVIDHVRAHVMVVDDEKDPSPAILEQLTRVLPVMLLTSGRPDETAVPPALAAYVAAVACKDDSPATLLHAIERAWESGRRRTGHDMFSRQWDDGSTDSDEVKISRLTTREKRLIVAMLCSDSESGKVIASRLCISEQTLRNHLSSIYGKLGVHNRLGLHTFAARHGLHRLAS